MSPADLIRASGVSRDLVYKYVDGKVGNPRGDVLERLARAIDLTPSELRYGVRETVSTQKIPLLNMSKLGKLSKPIDVLSVWDGVSSVIVAGTLGEGAFSVVLDDEACAPDFPAGSIIVCDPSAVVSPGKYVIAVVQGVGAVMRRYRKRDASSVEFWLISDNPDFPDIHVTKASTATVLGRAVKHIRDI